MEVLVKRVIRNWTHGDIFLILLPFPTTMATKAILPNIAHGFYGTMWARFFLVEVNLLFYCQERQELINDGCELRSSVLCEK
jgi:hypothetical protein